MKILVIDDDPAMTELLKLLLWNTTRDVLAANTGMDGLQLVKEAKPDVVLLDLLMPQMDGWSVCQEIRKFSAVPILILSALDSPDQVAAALDAGADDYLIKPVVSSVLVAHITRLVQRSRLGTGSLPNLRYHDMSL